ncbi:transglutaminase-like cysteine peptidase [Agrobacterium sp. RAC06]|uniref:transglutaminase-like cysteine peptidase n=1 Tax=Agrobacterium sp. RAC06 TaxID=1842536 RepID=UPI00083CC98C|nr:transglutaminase-like cysteine peptidase [Agrobacterium sp. RAC06]AOG12619.1 bacterial transglutaminase-like cysteine ase BTLCP family protein [Agrobacterium sp. RAC06]
MIKKTVMILAAVLAVGATTASQSYASQIGGFARQLDAKASRANAPLQMQLFCLQNPQDCKPSKAKVVSYSPKIEKTIRSINAAVNREIKPRREKRDIWSVNVKQGDCDDYVMTKRQRLIRAGIPASALRVAVVRTRMGEGHAVLIVKTTAGDFVLDNLRRNVVKRHSTGYQYVSVSSGNPLKWTR